MSTVNSTDKRQESYVLRNVASWFDGISNEDLARTLAYYGADASAFAAREELRQLLRSIPDQQRLEHYGRKVYSQNDEDGIIQEIFRRLNLNPSSGKFVEFGVGNGWECNTHFLLLRGFAGLWIEGSESYVQSIRHKFRRAIDSGQLTVSHSFVTAENINELLTSHLGDMEVSLLSIDIDGNDFWIWKAITSMKPPVVIIEYNSNFPPPVSITQEYDPNWVFKGAGYGASLEALVRLGRDKGYQLVGCTITGVNAFFVRNDLVKTHFPYEQTAENLYHPTRLQLVMRCFSNHSMNFGQESDFGGYVQIE